MKLAYELFGEDGDKSLIIEGSGPLAISIDFDDVDHAKVERAAEALVQLMNENSHLLTGFRKAKL